jgi:hypothetical protein
MTQRRRGIAILALACTLGLAGCSSSSEPDACSLLDQGTIVEGAGILVEKGKIDSDLSSDTVSVCAWRPKSGTFPVIMVYLSEGAEQVETQRLEAENGFGVPSVDVTVAGARDAYAAGNGSLIGMVVDDYFVQVSYLTTGIEDALDKTTPLAAVAAARMATE